MTATTMQASLLTMTPDAMPLLYACAKQCTSADDAGKTFDKTLTSDVMTGFPFVSTQTIDSFVRKVINSGHLSVLEHVSFSFAVSGVSRALSHQLVRHRIASYSQQSQRYVKANHFDYVVPPNIAAIPEALNLFIEHMKFLSDGYETLQTILKEHGHESTANEDARFVLPNACATKLVVTMNARALLHFFEERCCNRAQWEIRALAKAMLAICKDKLPVVFEKAGPKCKRLGKCPEAKPCRQHVGQMAKDRGAA